MSLLGPDIAIPDWIHRAVRYYSIIESDRYDSVQLMKPPDEGDVTETTPGTLCLRIVPTFRKILVIDDVGQEIGLIRPRESGFGFTMHNGCKLVWTLSSRSLLMRRHALRFPNGDQWVFFTPFFWWMNVIGRHGEATHVLGRVGPTMRFWILYVEPGRDNHNLLSALAFMHRRWWRH